MLVSRLKSMYNNKPKFACITTVRTNSSRLPGKALLDIRGKRVIDHIIERAKSVKSADVVIICTSTEPEDDILVDIAKQYNVECFRGSAKDRLGRMLGAVNKFGIDYIITCDGDDLFCDPELIDLAVSQMQKEPCDVIKYPDNLVCGTFTFCISADALRRAHEMSDTDDTEMYDVYLLETGAFDVRGLKIDDPIFFNGDWVRATLDYQEDLDFFRRIFDELKIDTNTVPFRQIMKLIQEKPEITKINFYRHKDFFAKREKMRLNNI